MTSPGVFGVDFSGASDAGKKIWIAEASVRDGYLSVRACFPARELPRSGIGRETALRALRELIVGHPDATFGLDVPFGLPAALVEQATWLAFVERFVGCYADADRFRAACWTAAGARELRRQTDAEARTPLCAYNLRLYKQTFHALESIVGPLVLAGSARAHPMQTRVAGAATLVEVCPASTLALHAVYEPYKGRRYAAARRRLGEWLVRATPMAMPADIRSLAAEDTNGDALDSLISAAAAWRASRSAETTSPLHRLEGFVHV